MVHLFYVFLHINKYHIILYNTNFYLPSIRLSLYWRNYAIFRDKNSLSESLEL